MEKESVEVVIVGAGPSGLASAACLAIQGVPHTILERDGCVASLWHNRCYERVHLHLAKHYCALPHAPHPPSTPLFIPGRRFADYLDAYAARFALRPRFGREVVSARFDSAAGRWRVTAREVATGAVEEHVARFLVVASGENDAPTAAADEAVEGFAGKVVHSSRYRSGKEYRGKRVLVVGSGNSGMEIALDLCDAGAHTSIVVRSPIHVVSREIYLFGMLLMKFLPSSWVDALVLFLCYLQYGNLCKLGIRRPQKGPFYLKANTPYYPVLDAGTIKKIKSGHIQVLPSLSSVKDNTVVFVDGRSYPFDAIILATGYKSTIKNWLKDDDSLIDDDGMAKKKFPDNWKGENGLYCAGLVRRGIYGSAEDAQKIAADIKNQLMFQK